MGRKSPAEGAHRGKATWFAGKETDPVTSSLTKPTHVTLNRVKEATSVSKSDLQEYAWRKVVGLPVPRELTALIRAAVATLDMEQVA